MYLQVKISPERGGKLEKKRKKRKKEETLWCFELSVEFLLTEVP